MRRSNLKLVEGVPFQRKEISLLSPDTTSSAHSLHQTISLPESTRPEIAQYVVDKFSVPGDVVLDPFCGSGTVPLEALLKGRIAFASDLNPLAVLAAQAKIEPADITEVTLFLQMINLRRPIDLNVYRSQFAHFYDVDTFREIVNLRSALSQKNDRVSRFVEMVASSLLHGHTAAFFSVYSFPQIALAAEEQERINCKRRQTPDYRAVVPRILRKTASALRDGVASSMRQFRSSHQVFQADARNLSTVATGGVNLLLCAPPLPVRRDAASELWLKLWFSGVPEQQIRQRLPNFAAEEPEMELEAWGEFMSEVLLEGARVVRSGGRAAFVLREVALRSAPIGLDHELLRVAQESFQRYWEPECTLVNTTRHAQIVGAKAQSERILILRRR